jgi:putative endonuclease
MRRNDAARRGARAENLAVWWLRLRGYRVLERRLTAPRGAGLGEVDIVARRGSVIAFVEVKWRPRLGDAAAAISRTQRRRIVRAARGYVASRPACAVCTIRFDAVLVSPWRFPRHLTDAWRAEE